MFARTKVFAYFMPFVIICLLLLNACGSTSSGSSSINVVAAENFYGNIVSQLGGSYVNVTSILSDPNVDPHEYTSNAQTALKVNQANLVIKNGLGYDDWMDKLLSSSTNPNRLVVTGGDVADHKLPDNPHVWYGIDNLPAISQAITNVLKKLDSAHASTFDSNLATFKQSLTPLQQKIDNIKAKYNGTPVTLTETIGLYQTTPAGLKVLTPFEFMKANAEGNDPPADAVTEVNNEINQKQAKVLIYNVQTVTAITTNVQNEAKQQNIPFVALSETMPPGKTYQTWMADQLDALTTALHQETGQ